ncbi:Nucleolar complex protein 2 like [Verticillium longisporum]|uniref:Nucleolar complex protein 2 like n=1 Tax=Verticillium longisporum TaxID=100787 RepID=A0A8I3ALM5_VERLO|nr:Nucleolar complex protein 2 like [Verticillium longisporum]
MPPSKKKLKATKKFEKNHLSGVLKKRKEDAKVKQRYALQAKKAGKKTREDASFFKGPKEEGAPKPHSNKKDANVSAMSVDDFFKGGFEDIIDKAPKGGKLGKRKRDAPNGKAKAPKADDDEEEQAGSDDEGMSDMSLEDQPVVSDSEDGADDSDIELDAEDGEMSKKAMDDLAKKDPSFYKFLKEHDPEALDFDENADMAEIDNLSAGSDASDDDQPKKKRKKDSKKKKNKKDESEDDETTAADNELTREMVAKWKELIIEKKSLRAARQVVLAFKCAAHLNEDDAEDGKNNRYTINSPQVFHDILIVALRQIPEVIAHHLPSKESAAGKVYVSTETKKFQTLSIMLKTYTASIIHLLGTLSDDATLKLTIGALEPLLPYLLSFRKLLKALIKCVVNFWARPASSEATRITAFLVLRKLMVIGDAGLREVVLKAVYQGLVQGSRVTNANTIQGINLMKNSAAELWGIDQNVGYTTAFTFIRQLAIHLRNSIVNNKDAAFKVVYNWQYTHSLDFWSTMLAQHCTPLTEAEAGKPSQLKLLVYPLVQVTLGATRLIPTATFFPLRFHLIRSLLRISRATNTYIPLAAPILEVLESAEMKRAPKAASLKPLDFRVAFKAPKAYLRTRVYQDGVGEQVVELFAEFFALWAKNIAFPEMALPVVIQLKRWLKQARRGDKGASSKKSQRGNQNGKLGSAIVLLVQKIEANAKFIEQRRAQVDFAPKDRAQVDNFLRDLEWEKTPIGAFVAVQRKLRAEKLKMMEEARREDDRRRKEERGDVDEPEEEEEDEDEEEYADELMDEDEDEEDDE